MRVHLINPNTGVMKEAKVGFSWTSFFFGGFVPLFRGDWLWLLVWIVLSPVTLGIFWILFAFLYNRIYINRLLENGYQPAGEFDYQGLINRKFTLNHPVF